MLLMIDNYDSFTFNLVQYFCELGEEVKVVRNDEVTLDEIAAFQALNLDAGVLYFQMIVTPHGPRVVEIAPRLDGCHMWRLIQHATGVDLLDMAIRHILSEPVEPPVWSGVRPAMLEFFCQAPDTSCNQAQAHPGAVHLEWYYEPGAIVRRMNGKMEKCGYQIVMADAS